MRFLQGNLLESKVEAPVNTVNTVGVMGKGIALMFKESFPANFLAYEEACKRKNVKIGRMFVTETEPLRVRIGLLIFQPRNIGGSPPNSNGSSKACKICGVQFRSTRFRSIALPPLGSGNGGLDWHDVRPEIERILGDLEGVDIEIYEPTCRILVPSSSSSSQWSVNFTERQWAI
jgi:O-acetyl-ADP-ribose deacetylase (regulator of RNase III)